MNLEKINIDKILSKFSDYWNPKIVVELNGQHIKLLKLKGKFVWHKHDDEDEMFYVIDGKLKIEFRNKTVMLNKNEFLIIPRGVEHKPSAENEVSVILFEPIGNVNTGDNPGDLTRINVERL